MKAFIIQIKKKKKSKVTCKPKTKICNILVIITIESRLNLISMQRTVSVMYTIDISIISSDDIYLGGHVAEPSLELYCSFCQSGWMGEPLYKKNVRSNPNTFWRLVGVPTAPPPPIYQEITAYPGNTSLLLLVGDLYIEHYRPTANNGPQHILQQRNWQKTLQKCYIFYRLSTQM